MNTTASYLIKIKNIQSNLLDFIDNEHPFSNLVSFLNDEKIKENKNDFKLLLHLIIKIANNHYKPNLYSKIEQILSFCKDEIIHSFSNSEIFQIFKSNKKILLTIVELNIMTIDIDLVMVMMKQQYRKPQYLEYFFPETRGFFSTSSIQHLIDSLPKDLPEIRKSGENDNYICNLIRNDLLDEFISYINKSNVSIDSPIQPSLFETHPILIENSPTLIEYAAYFGAINIFKYLLKNNVKINNSLWRYAIRSGNADIIHLLEDYKIEPEDKSFKQCFLESIKCYHDNIANYIQTNYLQEEDEKSIINTSQIFEYYNFEYLKVDMINASSFVYACKFDYITLVEILLHDSDIDINLKYIHHYNFG